MFSCPKKLVVKQQDREIYQTNETQGLYLYPLTLKDYVDNLNDKKPIKLDLLELDNNVDYEKIINHQYLNNLMCIEFNIENKKDLPIVERIINIKENVKVSLNIKNLNCLSLKDLELLSPKVDYFKIYWNYNDYDKFLKRIKCINKYKNNSCLVHVKSYLNLEEINNYEKYIKDFNNMVDVYQLSKELIPLNTTNVKVDEKIEKTIRYLEEKYSGDGITFISVKNLKELYYPRFELDERNSRVCYACYLKPYLYKDTIIPCKVREKLNNMDEWGTKDFNDFSNFKKCGLQCDDCASIYENDKLNEINNIIKEYKDIETIMEEER